MRTKTYKLANKNCKAYLKSAGKGWEVGFSWGSKTIFVGNFVYAKEARAWYSQMNQEIRKFAKKFSGNHKLSSTAWYSHFISSHLYRCYYKYLDKVFAQHTRSFEKAFHQDLKKYQQWKKHTPRTAFDRNFFKAAA